MSDSDISRLEKIKARARNFIESGRARKLYTVLLLLLLIWCTCTLFFGIDTCIPGSTAIDFIVLILCGKLVGSFVGAFKIPPLLGMLATGILFNNVDVFKPIAVNCYGQSSRVRSFAFSCLLLRAGLGLKFDVIKKNKALLSKLSVLPCVTEIIIIALLSKPLLNLPWPWAFLLGCVIAGVSPAVVIPGMLSLMERGYGTLAGVPTLLITSATADNIFTIIGFGIAYVVTFPDPEGQHIAMTIFKGPLEVIVGTLIGILAGYMMSLMSQEGPGNLQQWTLFFGGVVAFMGLKSVNFLGAGILAVLVMGTFAAQKWREPCKDAVAEKLQRRWKMILESALFTLTGALVELSYLTGELVGYGLLCLTVGLILRCATAFLSVYWSPLTLREKLFVVASWTPKATVQAAIGSIALDTVRETQPLDPVNESYGITVLCIAVIAIIFTSPLGAGLIAWLGPKYLDHKSPEELLPLRSSPEKEDSEDGRAGSQSLSNHSNGNISNHSNGISINNHSMNDSRNYGLNAEDNSDGKKQP